MIDDLNIGDQFIVSEDCEQCGAEFVAGMVYTVVESDKDCDWYEVTPGDGADDRWYFGLDEYSGDLASKIKLVVN